MFQEYINQHSTMLMTGEEEMPKSKQEVVEGDFIECVLVTGEIGHGTYSLTRRATGSHLVENIVLEDGRELDYGWASEVYHY